MQTPLNNKIYVNRYLCKNAEEQNLDHKGFLCANLNFKNEDFTYSMDSYFTFEKIKDAPFNFIFGNGGLGKSTFLTQIEKSLNQDSIKYIRVNLRELSYEKTLSDKLTLFCKDNYELKNLYVILDAVDEAIDIGIINVDCVIKEAIKSCIEINPNVKTIITCRDNRIPDNLIQYLKDLYKTTLSNTYSLCVLTEQDCRDIAENCNCLDVDDFLNKINEYNLGCFAASPITLVPLIEMYNNNKITETTCQFDIYENLMSYLCDETAFRKEKDINQELKKNLFPIEELLFVASKIAIELKFNKKKYITIDSNDIQGVYFEQILNKKFYLHNRKMISISKDLILATLNTKIFYKSGKNYYISQQTYLDFLVARYIYQMKLTFRQYKQLLTIDNKVYHPILTESIAFLSIKDKKFFDDIIKQIPERILLSSVNFIDITQRKKLFKAYLKCVKEGGINLWGSRYSRKTFHQRLYFNNVEKDINWNLKDSNNKVLVALLEFITDNGIDKYQKEIEEIIFSKKSEASLKVTAILAAEKFNYKNLLEKMAENITFFDDDINDDTDYQVLGSLLSALYPKRYISDDLMLSCLREVNNDSYFGRYHHFLSSILPEQINDANAEKFLIWMKHNKLKGVVTDVYGTNYSRFARKIFDSISEYLSEDLIPAIVNLYLSQEHVYYFLSDKILNNIEENDILRRNFLRTLVFSTDNNQIFQKFFHVIESRNFHTNDISYFLELYLHEQTEYVLENLETLINSMFCRFMNNETYDDVEEIYNIVNTSLKLKTKFEGFFAPVEISSETGEPILECFKIHRNCYFRELKRKEKEEKEKQSAIEVNKIEENVANILNNRTKDSNIGNMILNIFQYLGVEPGTTHSYNNLSIDINEYMRWKDLNELTQHRVINLVMEFLLEEQKSEYYKVEKYIKESSFLNYWKTFSLLPFIKESKIESYNDILLKWCEPIVYISIYEPNEIAIKQNIIKDIYNLDSNKLFDIIFVIFKSCNSSLPSNFFKSFDLVWNDNFTKWLFEKIDLSQENISFAILKVLAEKKYTPIKDYIMKKVLDEQISDENLSELLSLLLYEFPETWSFVRKIIEKLDDSLKFFNSISNKTPFLSEFSDNSMLNRLSSKSLSELYILIVKKYSYVNEETPLGVHSVDSLKDFVNKIPQIFVDNCDEKALIKIKSAYFTNRNSKDYNIYYQRLRNRLIYNKQLKTPLNYLKFEKLESKCYGKKNVLFEINKQGDFVMKTEYKFFNCKNTVVKHNENQNNIKISASLVFSLIVLVIIVTLFWFKIITVQQFIDILSIL